MARERTLERHVLLEGGVPLQAAQHGHAQIGLVRELYVDTETGQPEWAFVTLRLSRDKGTFVPLADADVQPDRISVPFGMDQLEEALQVPRGTQLSAEQADALSEHFGSTASGLKVRGADADPMDVETSPQRREADPLVAAALRRVRARIDAGNEHLSASQQALAAAIELGRQRPAQRSGQRGTTRASSSR